MDIEISDEQWQAIGDDYERHQRDEARRLGFVEINLMDELKKDWRARGILDDNGQPIC